MVALSVVAVVVPFARMRRLICDKDCETGIAVAHVCEVSLATASDGDVSWVGFETYENLLSSLHGQNRGRHFWVSSHALRRSFGQESVIVIDYAPAHYHDVNVKQYHGEGEGSVNVIDWSKWSQPSRRSNVMTPRAIFCEASQRRRSFACDHAQQRLI